MPPHRSLSTVTQIGQTQRPAPTNGWFRSESQIRNSPDSNSCGVHLHTDMNKSRKKFCRDRPPTSECQSLTTSPKSRNKCNGVPFE